MRHLPTKKWKPALSRLICACASLILLVACQADDPDAQYRNYLSRLGRTLSVETPAINPMTLPRPPRTGQLRLAIPSGSLDTLDFLTLSGCAVQATIGKRNSSLGRMARDSQRLLLELEYLRLAPRCIDDLRDSNKDALADILRQSWQLRRQQLPALIFNATLGGPEYRAFWLTPPALRDYPASTGSRVIAALQTINSHTRRWLGGDYQAHNRDFEILLSEVATGDGGALLAALARQGDWLGAADLILKQRMTQGPLCSPRIRNAAADILPNVIHKYFIGEIQPRAATLGRRYYELLPPVAALEGLLSATLAANYRTWMIDRNHRLAEASSAPGRHVARLKAIQQPCLTPG